MPLVPQDPQPSTKLNLGEIAAVQSVTRDPDTFRLQEIEQASKQGELLDIDAIQSVNQNRPGTGVQVGFENMLLEKMPRNNHSIVAQSQVIDAEPMPQKPVTQRDTKSNVNEKSIT